MAAKHEELGLSAEQLLEMYQYMLSARMTDERMTLLQRSGKINFTVSCQGQEAAQVGAAFAMDTAIDWLAPYYRDIGLVLRFGHTLTDLMYSVFAREEDPNSGGRQLPGHFGGKKYRTITGSSPVGTQLPHAVGFALAAKMRGEQSVVLTTLGEGATNQGDFHEGCNFAGVHKLPVIFFCENNQYAISVSLKMQLGCENVADRGVAYGFPGVIADGMDVLDVYRVCKEAVTRARAGEGPTLIEAKTYRLKPHTSDDDDMRYRTKEEVEEAKKRDPILVFRTYLAEHGILTPFLEESIKKQIEIGLDEATAAAEQAAFAPPESAERFVYAEQ
ncbi:MAG: 2-oxoisovalerate dehydrogenase subunit alpha [Bacilli bacterium]|nr:2-oxoisovalerate dehydrogenase subunit alpha [Bacilli bacterium]